MTTIAPTKQSGQRSQPHHNVALDKLKALASHSQLQGARQHAPTKSTSRAARGVSQTTANSPSANQLALPRKLASRSRPRQAKAYASVKAKGRAASRSRSHKSKSKWQELSEGEDVFEVEDILDSCGKEFDRKFLVKWKGYKKSESTWEPLVNLQNCLDLVKKFIKARNNDGGQVPYVPVDSDSEILVEDLNEVANVSIVDAQRDQTEQEEEAEEEEDVSICNLPREQETFAEKVRKLPLTKKGESGNPIELSSGKKLKITRRNKTAVSKAKDQDVLEIINKEIETKIRNHEAAKSRSKPNLANKPPPAKTVKPISTAKTNTNSRTNKMAVEVSISEAQNASIIIDLGEEPCRAQENRRRGQSKKGESKPTNKNTAPNANANVSANLSSSYVDVAENSQPVFSQTPRIEEAKSVANYKIIRGQPHFCLNWSGKTSNNFSKNLFFSFDQVEANKPSILTQYLKKHLIEQHK